MRLLLVAMITCLVARTGSAEEPKLPGPTIKFPDVPGAKRQKPTVFKDTHLGYSVSYVGEKSSLLVTAYVYNLGRTKIAPGTDSDEVKAEMLESINALEANKTTGRYKTLSPIVETLVKPGGENAVAFRRKRYEVDIAKEGLATTELYLTAYKDHFIKLRVTYLDVDKADSEKLVGKLLEALTAELK